jgi:hypothetical protein
VSCSSFFQGCGSAFISSWSGSSVLGWIPIRIQSGSGALMTKNLRKKLQLKILFYFLDQKLPVPFPRPP